MGKADMSLDGYVRSCGLRKNIDHIKEIVAMQQSYAKVSGLAERPQLLT